MLFGALFGDVIARVGVAHYATSGVIPQYALDARCRGIRSVAADDEAGMLGIAHADAAAVVKGNQGSAAGGAQQQI